MSEGTLSDQDGLFEPLWDSLWPVERCHILSLLVEGIHYDGRDGSLTVEVRPDGIGSLANVQPG